jgi:hypothetical protein
VFYFVLSTYTGALIQAGAFVQLRGSGFKARDAEKELSGNAVARNIEPGESDFKAMSRLKE